MLVEYDGTEFCGWQIQPDERTVQGALEGVLQVFLGHATRVSAAGRTDSGVHASAQVVCFDTDRDLSAPLIQRALNALTPDDIAIVAVEEVAGDFDPRRDARRRAYVYRIWNRRTASPFWGRYAWHIGRQLCRDALVAAAPALEGEHDFTSFRASGCDAVHPTRRVFSSRFECRDDLLLYEIEATAFLRHMVRNIVGTLVEIGTGARAADSLPTLLQARDRDQAGATAPARGLCLTRVEY
jgi:tRNA pseudouridine38-40 synthase